MSRLIATIERRPELAFTVFLALHFFVWTVLPALLYPNLPLDLIEALTYGREWQLGYDKLPPLPWWLVEIVYRLVGHDFAYYALAQLAVIGALCAGLVDRATHGRADPARLSPCSSSMACIISIIPRPSSTTM